MTALEQATANLTAAVAAAPPTPAALVAVKAGDSAACAAAVPDPDETVLALLKGAKAHPPARTVLQQAGDLRHLLAKLPPPPQA